MRIIKRGVDPANIERVATCKNCTTEVAILENELLEKKPLSSAKMVLSEKHKYIVCPICSDFIKFKSFSDLPLAQPSRPPTSR